MVRTAIGLAIGIAFVAAVIFYALDATSVRCEICVEYKGRHACSASQAADLAMAEMQAHSGACSQITGGVTETLECDRLPAASKVCSE